MIFQFRVDMFLRPNNEKITSDFIMCVCVYSKYTHLQNSSKTNEFLCQISRLFILLNIVHFTDYSCSCINKTSMNATQLSARIEQLKSLLRIDKKQTTTERQKKISAKDDRVSSVSIGLIFGVGVLVSSSLAIVISDFTAIYRDIRNGPLACKKKLSIFNFRNKHSWYEAERHELVWFVKSKNNNDLIFVPFNIIESITYWNKRKLLQWKSSLQTKRLLIFAPYRTFS